MSELKINSSLPSKNVFGTSNIDNSLTSTDSSSSSGVSFADTLTSALNSVNDKQVASEKATNALVSGDDVDISDVMLASSEAKVSLQLAVEVRNKLVSAYNEITKMSL